MSVFRRDSKGRVAGVRCDWCGKIANNADACYDRPIKNEHGVALAGYIHAPDWDKESGKDICEECANDRCPACGSDSVVKLTPAVPGPDGWGGRCKACRHQWGVNLDTTGN